MSTSPVQIFRPIVLILFGIFILPHPFAMADAVSFAPGKVRTPSGGDLKAGPGAVCAHASVSKENDPGAGGSPCSDETKIGIPGGIEGPIITRDTTFDIGNAQTRAYGTPAPQGGGLPVGRAILYQRTERNDKVAEAKLNRNKLTLTVDAKKTIQTSEAKARATQTIETPVGKAGKITGLATSSVHAGNPVRPAFGVSIVNDPVGIEPDSISIDDFLDVTIGDAETGDLLKLQAEGPNEFAFASYELGINSQIVLNMRILLDSSMKKLEDLDVEFFTYDKDFFGFANEDLFFDSKIEPFLNEIDSVNHLLTAKGEIPLAHIQLDGTPFVLTYNYVAGAGITAPEPSTLILMLLGLSLGISIVWLSKRGTRLA